jgi:hypothetical protein
VLSSEQSGHFIFFCTSGFPNTSPDRLMAKQHWNVNPLALLFNGMSSHKRNKANNALRIWNLNERIPRLEIDTETSRICFKFFVSPDNRLKSNEKLICRLLNKQKREALCFPLVSTLIQFITSFHCQPP